MKNLFCLIGVMAMLSIASGIASAASSIDTTVKVPFSFIVGNTELPAGNYVVKAYPDAADIVALVSADGHKYATILTVEHQSTEQTTTPELLFQKYDDHYFLASVTSEGTQKEVVLTPATMRKEIAATSMNELASLGKQVPIN